MTIVGYVSADGTHIQTWDGCYVAPLRITAAWRNERRRSYHCEVGRVTYHGTAAGPSSAIMMKSVRGGL